jgi:HSP20 family protein
MEEDRRKDLRDVLDELDKYFEELEKSIHETVRESLAAARSSAKPIVAGFSFAMGPEGKPSIQFFGDSPTHAGGYRSPISEQVVDSKGGLLRLVIEMPGVDKEHIQVEAKEDSVIVSAEKGNRKYKAEIDLKAEVDPNSGRAEYTNGILEISFSMRDKANKGFKRVDIV